MHMLRHQLTTPSTNLSSRPKHRGFMRCAAERSQHSAQTAANLSPSILTHAPNGKLRFPELTCPLLKPIATGPSK
ncbi:MAG: hypothetical protein M3R43_01720, partial [Acidobacteriota bacterium]|nr:hypothetical protein [Acidobacteriota bacterium]